MSGVEISVYGHVDETAVHAITLTNPLGCRACVISYGARLTSLQVPDPGSKSVDVVLGYASLADYQRDRFYMGCTVGRVAGRIADATFRLPASAASAEARVCHLDTNCGQHHLHGGFNGFDRRVWQWHVHGGREEEGGVSGDTNDAAVTFSLLSSASDCGGYPGSIICQATYRLSANTNTLTVEYRALADSVTPLNLANHTYWNLAGHAAGPGALRRHTVSLEPTARLECNDDCTVSGRVVDVGDTVYRLSGSLNLAEAMLKLPAWPGDNQTGASEDKDNDEEADAGYSGFDFYYCWPVGERAASSASLRQVSRVACVTSPDTGISMSVSTDQPGVQFYTGNFLHRLSYVTAKDRAIYRRHSGLCLETQGYPNAVNFAHFPSVFLHPGQCYRHTTVYHFSSVASENS